MDNLDNEVEARRFVSLVARNRWLVASVAAATVAAAAVLIQLQAPVFESTATLRIDEKDSQSFLTELASMPLPSGGKLETEIAVLRSRQLAEVVVDSLGLALQLKAPSGQARDEIIQVLDLPPSRAIRGEFTLHPKGDGVYSLEAQGVPAGTQVPRVVQAGVPFRVGPASLVLAPEPGTPAETPIEFTIVPFQDAVRAMRNVLVISRPDPRAQIVEIRYQSTDPALAAAVPNAISDAYIRSQRSSIRAESRTAVKFLREQVLNYAVDLRQAEDRLRTFRESEQVLSITDQATEQVKRLAELRARRDAISAEQDALSELLGQAAEGQEQGAGTSKYRQLSSFPVFFGNAAVQNILHSLTELENRRAELLVRRTAENDDVRGIDQRVQELERELYRIALNYHRSLASELVSIESTLDRFSAQSAAIPAREIEFARLSREQKLLSEIYSMLQTRLKDAELREAVESDNARPIDPALVPDDPISPKPVRIIFFALVGGLLLGVGVSAARESLDTRVHSERDVQIATNGLPVLATIPLLQAGGNGAVAAVRIRIGTSRIIPRAPTSKELPGSRLVTQHQPHSPAAEAYRSLRTSIAFSRIEDPPRVIAVTSAMPGEGKSTSASNLAVALAQQGLRTVLVDADLRRGTLCRELGHDRDPGLSHVLAGRTSLAEAVQNTGLGPMDTPLEFLSTGVYPPDPAELFSSSRMRHLVEELRERYEFVVLDLPPLNLVTDAAVVGSLADTTILITRAGVTERRALRLAAARLRQLRTPVTGVVLNGLSTPESRYQYGNEAEPSTNGKAAVHA